MSGRRAKTLGHLPGDEQLRQHMRLVRKEARKPDMQDQIRAAIAEHKQSITKARELAQGYHEKLQTLAVDVERRQGAIAALRQLLSSQPVPVPDFASQVPSLALPPEPPPADNDHVAPGCERFPDVPESAERAP